MDLPGNYKAGVIAKKNYQKLKYFPFENPAGCSFILTANPFSYLQAWLDNQIRQFGRSSKNKRRLEKAKYFCELAESFNQSAEKSKLPVKGTLLYYAHLNLVKSFLLVEGFDLETSLEHHGLSMPPKYDKKIKIGGKPGEGLSIFREFSKLMGDDVQSNSGYKISLDELLVEMPEVHEIGHALSIYPGKRKFLPIEILIKTNDGIYNKLFYEIRFKDSLRQIMPVHKLKRNHFKDKIFELHRSDKITYRSHSTPSFTNSKDSSWNRCYHKITKELENIGATTMLTKQGYRYYMNLDPGKLHRLSSSFALMYYLGSVARYRPTLYDKILLGEYQPIINEVIQTCPRQFYYLLVSRITSQVCALPMAKI